MKDQKTIDELTKTFTDAWGQWEDASDSSQLIALFEGHDELDLTASNQKGCDCTAIEINGRYGCAYDTSDSWDACGLVIEILNETYGCVELLSDYTGWRIKCHPDGPSVIGPTILYALLLAAYLHNEVFAGKGVEKEIKMNKQRTLGDALPAEMARVRDKILPVYDSLGQAGSIAAAMMRHDLNVAARAIEQGDLAAMIQIYESLKGYEL